MELCRNSIPENEADRIFERFPEYIRSFIYRHGWDRLRGVQIAAARTLFMTDHHLLLTSSTASGKTEAAFFPILTMLSETPPSSVGVLYIAPLKSLINDQFDRMQELLDESGVRVTHWHGDVTASHKKKLLERPEGILQITPESLESMMINRYNDIPRLFGDLRFVVVDEIHTLMGSDRGNQILCLLARLSRAIGHGFRRIGLSATLGNPALAAKWLAGAGMNARNRYRSIFRSLRRERSDGASAWSISISETITRISQRRQVRRIPKRGTPCLPRP